MYTILSNSFVCWFSVHILYNYLLFSKGIVKNLCLQCIRYRVINHDSIIVEIIIGHLMVEEWPIIFGERLNDD